MTQTKAELLQTRHQGDIRLGDADSSHYVGFKAPATVGTSLVWTLPAADGTANYLLKTDGSGNLGWVADSTTDSTKMPLAGGIFTGDVTFDGATAGRDIVFDRSDNALEFADDAKLTFGTDADLKIYHDQSNSYLWDTGTGDLHIMASDDLKLRSDDIHLMSYSGDETFARFIDDGAVELYHDNVKQLETTTDGIKITGSGYVDFPDSGRIRMGTGYDFALYHDGSDSWIRDAGTGRLLIDGSEIHIRKYGTSETMAKFIQDGAVELYHDNSVKLYTTTSGANITGTLNLNAITNNTVQDFFIGHAAQGDLYIYAQDNTNNSVIIQANTGEKYIEAKMGSSVDLYHHGTKKIETTSAGAKFTGGIAQVVTAAAALDLDLNTSNYFTKTISGNSTFTFSNPAASGQVTAFTLELTHSSGTVTWPSSVKWNADTAPTLTTGKTHLFMFVTDDGGSRYRGSALVDYVN